MTLVPPDSPLRKVPITLERRAVLFYDAIRYSLHVFDLAASRLAGAIDVLSEETVNHERLSEPIASAISDAWLLIDSTHRLRELVEQAPKLKKKQPEVQLFLRRTAIAEKLRHFFQHFRTGIEAYVATAQPIWGTLSWARNNPETGDPECWIIAPGTFFEGALVPTCTFNAQQFRFVERVRLQAGHLKVDLASLVENVAEFAAWYTDWFKTANSGEQHHSSDFHARFSVKPVRRPLSADSRGKE
jgi:hypothetical protein